MDICIIYILQKGFDTLMSMVPELVESASGKESRSSMLFKSRYLPLIFGSKQFDEVAKGWQNHFSQTMGTMLHLQIFWKEI